MPKQNKKSYSATILIKNNRLYSDFAAKDPNACKPKSTIQKVNETPVITAGIIIIGDEILSGRTPEKNLAYMAKKLHALGIHIIEAKIIADKPQHIIDSVNQFRTHYDYVFTTGGIGPTHDDITTTAIANAFATTLEENATIAKLLTKKASTKASNQAKMKMAQIPKGAKLIDNPLSIAPGFQIENVFVMAGVPEIMQLMFDGITDRLSRGEPINTISIETNIGESTFATSLATLQGQYPDTSIGSYPQLRDMKPSVSLVIRDINKDRLIILQKKLTAMITELGGQILNITKSI